MKTFEEMAKEFEEEMDDVNPWVDYVQHWQDTFEQKRHLTTYDSIYNLLLHRGELVIEETTEFKAALVAIVTRMAAGKDASPKQWAELLDAIVDSIWVLIGTANALGFDLTNAFEEVWRSNLSKLGEDGKPIYDKNGKVAKGPNFFKPELRPFLGQFKEN